MRRMEWLAINPVVFISTLLFLTCVVQGRSVDHSGDCNYSFQVFLPNEDVTKRIQSLEHSCRNDSWHLRQQFLQLQLQVQEEKSNIENVSNKLEKSLLMERLQQAQLGGATVHDTVKDQLKEMRNENDKLWDAYRTLSNSVGDGETELQLLHFPSSSKQISRLREDLIDMEDFLTQVKRGVGDLRAEWVVIKREVLSVNSGNAQIKMGQNALRDDTVKLKDMIEELRSDTSLMKDQQSQLKDSLDKITKTVSDVKQAQQQSTIADMGSVPEDLLSLGQRVQELSREVQEMKRQAVVSKKEILAVALAARNVSKDEIGRWLQKLPALQVPSVTPVQVAVPRDCQDVFRNGHRASGVYTITPRLLHQMESVYCELDDEFGWTVFQRRTEGQLSFTRRWLEYKFGFGSLYNEFWLGNELLHLLTGVKQYVLRVDMWDWEGKRWYAQYDSFSIDSEDDKYRIRVMGFHGDAGDSLSALHNNMAFSTEDSDNDHYRFNCAQMNKGGWWYNSCYSSNLNGVYHMGHYSQTISDGIVWFSLKNSDNYSLRKVEMKIKPA